MGAKAVLKGIIYAVVDFVTLYYLPMYFISLFKQQGVFLPKFDEQLLLYITISIAFLTLLANAIGKLPGAIIDGIKIGPRVYYTVKLFRMISLIVIKRVVEGREIVITITVNFGWIYWATIIGVLLIGTRSVLTKVYAELKEREKRREKEWLKLS